MFMFQRLNSTRDFTLPNTQRLLLSKAKDQERGNPGARGCPRCTPFSNPRGSFAGSAGHGLDVGESMVTFEMKEKEKAFSPPKLAAVRLVCVWQLSKKHRARWVSTFDKFRNAVPPPGPRRRRPYRSTCLDSRLE